MQWAFEGSQVQGAVWTVVVHWAMIIKVCWEDSLCRVQWAFEGSWGQTVYVRWCSGPKGMQQECKMWDSYTFTGGKWKWKSLPHWSFKKGGSSWCISWTTLVISGLDEDQPVETRWVIDRKWHGFQKPCRYRERLSYLQASKWAFVHPKWLSIDWDLSEMTVLDEQRLVLKRIPVIP